MAAIISKFQIIHVRRNTQARQHLVLPAADWAIAVVSILAWLAMLSVTG